MQCKRSLRGARTPLVDCQQTKLALGLSFFNGPFTVLQVKLIDCFLTTSIAFINLAINSLITCRTKSGSGGKRIEGLLFKSFAKPNFCVCTTSGKSCQKTLDFNRRATTRNILSFPYLGILLVFSAVWYIFSLYRHSIDIPPFSS